MECTSDWRAGFWLTREPELREQASGRAGECRRCSGTRGSRPDGKKCFGGGGYLGDPDFELRFLEYERSKKGTLRASTRTGSLEGRIVIYIFLWKIPCPRSPDPRPSSRLPVGPWMFRSFPSPMAAHGTPHPYSITREVGRRKTKVKFRLTLD